MSYTAWSVVYGEQPTAAKWNQLGSNDAGFRDGTNIDDSVIDSRHYIDNSIDAEHLSTSTIKLGKVRRTSNFTTTSTSDVLVTGMELTVNIPSGGRDVLVMVQGSNMYYSVGSGAQYNAAMLWDGAVTSGTPLARNQFNENSGAGQVPLMLMAVLDAPAAGSKTFRLSLRAGSAGAGAGIEANTNYPLTMVAMVI